MIPRSSITMMASGTVSRIDVRRALRSSRACLLLLAFRDVADDADEDLAVAAAGFADRQFQRKDRPVLAAAMDLPADADDPAAAGLMVIPQIGIVLLLIGSRHQHFDVLADNFIGFIAEQAQAGRVAGLHLT